jgi:hypothetical protein
VIKSAVRGVVVTALTTAFALLPMPAQAEESDADNDIERVELTGVVSHDTSPVLPWSGASWVTRLKLYTEKKTASGSQLRRAGDAQSDCSVIRFSVDRPWPSDHLGHVTTQCTRVLRLRHGTLTLSDMFTYRWGKRVTGKTAIVGGTGRYHSAYGDGYITLDGRRVHLELNVDE